MGFFSSIGSGIAGGFLGAITDPIKQITSAITEVQIAKTKAQTDAEKLEADQQIAQLEARKAVLMQESKERSFQSIQAFLALPVVIFLWKVLVFDLVLAQWLHWSTPDPQPKLWYIIGIIITFYFANRMIDKFWVGR